MFFLRRIGCSLSKTSLSQWHPMKSPGQVEAVPSKSCAVSCHVKQSNEKEKLPFGPAGLMFVIPGFA